jgi:hypothetical protein
MPMSSSKKLPAVFDDQQNTKIQRKFNSVFSASENSNSEKSDDNNDDFSLNSDTGSGFELEKTGFTSENLNTTNSEINLDFSIGDGDDDIEMPTTISKLADENNKSTSSDVFADGLDFSLDFDMTDGLGTASNESTKSDVIESGITESEDDFLGLELGSDDVVDMEMDELTKKTIIVNKDQLTNSNLETFSLGDQSFDNSSSEFMSSEEEKANIESTMKDILRPKDGNTQEFVIEDLNSDSMGVDSENLTSLTDIENSELSFRDSTPSSAFNLNEIMENKNLASDTKSNANATQNFTFDSGSLDEEIATIKTESAATKIFSDSPITRRPSVDEEHSSMNMEDSMRYQATIRALREERDDILATVKNSKSEYKELLQDNLTLKANLDEAKIEITILRKRQMVELEDIKYRLGMSEEKKAMADERARQADLRREKLEQKVRIDFNQVKQREKELESKLELLTMDVDSQVQSRDQKILELRRKIDALEFNMENTSIKEQKSHEDKRKLEDRLNKIMKTLRNSIKNLEEDIDLVQEDDHLKDKDS